jgi:hypothetical protein
MDNLLSGMKVCQLAFIRAEIGDMHARIRQWMDHHGIEKALAGPGCCLSIFPSDWLSIIYQRNLE